METSSALPKKSRRFVEAWLSNERYKNWISKVPSDETMYHCSVCNRNFSCNAAHVYRHADSACHRNNLKENLENISLSKKPVFRNEWLDIIDYKLWLRTLPHDKSVYYCTICDESYVAYISHIRRHAESQRHLNNYKQKVSTEASTLNDSDTQDDESLSSFEERKKAAEIKYATLIAKKNIPHQTAQEILRFFQHIDPEVLKSMKMGRTKCRNVISNVLCPTENKYVTSKLQQTKFSVFIDETSDISNEKWMTFFVRYVDPETLDIRSQLVKLINIDAKDSSAEKLFDAFKTEMWKLQIPFTNIIALSCDNASVMTGKHLSFKVKLQEKCKHLLTFPCPCHSAALVAHAASAKIPPYCDEFLRKVTTFITTSPKRLAIFREFCECFEEKHRNILKLSDTRWLSHHACVERIIELWDTIQRFLQDMVVEDKTKCGEYLLSLMENVELKAYLLFLKYILHFFNAFNAFFQASETRIHLLQFKSANFLSEICQNFIRKEYLKDVATNMNFSQKEIQININEICVGSECKRYLDELEGHADTVATIRQTCLEFYLTAAEQICKRLPVKDEFLTKLQVFGPIISLFENNREISFKHVNFVAKTLGGFDEESLRKEWLTLPADFTLEEKKNLSKLNFDNMWKEMLQRELNNNYKYPALRNLLSAVRSLPNSNADPERTFSNLTDIKSKKRNKLSSFSVNATCVVQSALKTRDETPANMTISQQHLSYMSADKLYAPSPKRQKSCLTLYAADVGPSTSTQ